MRIDVVTIFPGYLAPLQLSLLGTACDAGLLDIAVHDLRDFTHDRHRTVDDTPYGGGAGMVMKPEPWGEALDHVGTLGPPGTVPHLIVPSPAGRPFTQAMARALSAEPWLAVACGRYEGIDERVIDEATSRGPVSVVSLGDYVLNGGEVAALAIIEAVGRLVDGVVGNAESLVEESHEGGLLEYPVFTKPPVWRGRAVPEVLRSGDHGRIAAWRHEQRVRRTASRRPDLLPASAAAYPGGLSPILARPADAEELLVLQRCCWVPEGRANQAFDIPPLVEQLDDVRASIREWNTWVVRVDGRLVASMRGRLDADGAWEIGRLMVAPDLQGRGIGRWLLEIAEAAAPAEADRVWLVTGDHSTRNQRFYRRAGYRAQPTSPIPGTRRFVKVLPQT
jgi:tRNA (guanine37-N1)-methyltransferase